MLRRMFAVGLVSCAVLAGCRSEPGASSQIDTDWPTGYSVPIESATFPLLPEHLPGEDHASREGARRGFDFVSGYVSRPLSPGLEVVAVAPGTVVRADRGFEPLADDARAFLLQRAGEEGVIAGHAIDRLLGRQVWIEHQGGYVSRYGHLSEIGDGVTVGQPIEMGAVIGRLGGGNRAAAGADGERTAPRLHFELFDRRGRTLGTGLTPLEIHERIARIFGDAALPRHAREAVAAVRAGEAPPRAYPPDPIPETGFSVEVPTEVVGGDTRAIAVTWEGNAFETDGFFASLNGATLGFIDAGNGAWLLLPAPNVVQSTEATLLVGGIDRYGKSLIGRQSLRFSAREQAAPPVEVSPEAYERLTEGDAEQAESRLLARATAASLQIREPLWNQPFRSPVEGRLIQDFGQQIVSGPFRPASASPGWVIRTEDQRAVGASNAGRVALAETLPLRGLTVAVVHGGGLITVYAGLDTVAAAVEQQLESGQILGSVGSNDEPGQLRFEVHVGGIPVDPRTWLDRRLPPRSE